MAKILGTCDPPVEAEDANTEAWRRAEIPSAGGHGNARSVAAVQSALACGGTVSGVRLLSEVGCERVLEASLQTTCDNTSPVVASR